VLLILCLWPADFELTGKGKLQTSSKREVFANLDGNVFEVLVNHGDMVKKGQVLARMQNVDNDTKIAIARGQLQQSKQQLLSAANRLSESGLNKSDTARLRGEQRKLAEEVKSYQLQLKLLEYKKQQLIVTSPVDGQVTTWKVYTELINRPVQQGNRLMTIVEPQGDWELEVQMPEDRMGFINDAQAALGQDLPVKYITATNPGVTHIGSVKEVHRSAEVRGEEGNTVLVRVAIDKNDVPDRRPGATVTAKVHCGRRSIGYAWFHDLVSFVQAKILFRVF
jgi:multidrug efflux pump subunit AcrA (membrane-fusion protein)